MAELLIRFFDLLRTLAGLIALTIRGLGITALWTGIAYPVYPYFDPVTS